MLTEILSFLLLTLQPVQSEKCYAAAMEGGGMCGAYEAGALMALTEKLSPSEIAYNIIGGISIGAYNSCWLSGFEVGDERNMAIYLQNVWLSITKTSQTQIPSDDTLIKEIVNMPDVKKILKEENAKDETLNYILTTFNLPIGFYLQVWLYLLDSLNKNLQHLFFY